LLQAQPARELKAAPFLLQPQWVPRARVRPEQALLQVRVRPEQALLQVRGQPVQALQVQALLRVQVRLAQRG
jgi:hypothetical protein